MLTASVENMLVTSINTTLETGVVPTQYIVIISTVGQQSEVGIQHWIDVGPIVNFCLGGQITAPRRPINIRISTDYSIFEKGAQKIDCYVGYVASGPVVLKQNVVHVILFNFWKQKFVEHGTVTLAIDRNGGSMLIL